MNLDQELPTVDLSPEHVDLIMQKLAKDKARVDLGVEELRGKLRDFEACPNMPASHFLSGLAYQINLLQAANGGTTTPKSVLFLVEVRLKLALSRKLDNSADATDLEFIELVGDNLKPLL